ncbi:MAG: 50S ribosomal protein L21e [Nitrososphaerota archaeon]|nr:50S ribosomal protein L21e [Candidatus Geocrenenecus dongiae]
MPKSKGYRYKSRRIMSKPRGARSGPRPEVYLSEYNPGDKVVIKIDPSIHKGAPHRRYHGKVGEIVEKRGRAYVVSVKVGDKMKYLTLLPDHLSRWVAS